MLWLNTQIEDDENDEEFRNDMRISATFEFWVEQFPLGVFNVDPDAARAREPISLYSITLTLCPYLISYLESTLVSFY